MSRTSLQSLRALALLAVTSLALLPSALGAEGSLRSSRLPPMLSNFFEEDGTVKAPPSTIDMDSMDSYAHHEVLLSALRSKNGMGFVRYEVDFGTHYQYVLDMEVDVLDRVLLLDDHVGDISSFEGEAGEVLVLHSTAPSLSIGDFVVGSHEGSWNDLVDVKHPYGHGITYAREVRSVAVDPSTGATRVTTARAHPQQMVSRSGMKLALNLTDSEVRLPARKLEEDWELKAWCEEACQSKKYYRTTPDAETGMFINVCDKCFEVTKTFFNYVTFNWDKEKQKPMYEKFDIGNGKGIVCHDCFAYLGTQLEFEFEYTPLYLKHFKVAYGGAIGFNYNITIDDPQFPPFWAQEYSAMEAPDGPGKLLIRPNVQIPIGPPKPMPPPLPPLPCNDVSPTFTPTGALNAVGLRFFDTCVIFLAIEGDFGMKLLGLGSALGHTSTSFGLFGSGALGIEYNKFNAMENGQWKFWDWKGIYNPPQALNFTDFRTDGISVEVTFSPLVRFGIGGGTFPFNMLELTTELAFEPTVGYEARPGADVGTFALSVTPPPNGYYAGGEKATMKLTYSGYTREDAVFIAIRNDCWPPDQYMPIFSQRNSFTGSGVVNLEWVVPYNDLLQVKSLDTGGFMCDWGPNKDKDEYGGFLCTDWFTKCKKDDWVLHPKLATQPFMEIAPSTPFKLIVNDLDSHIGIGVTEPINNAVAVSGQPFSFKWDTKGFVHYAGNSEISAQVPVTNVDIKLFYFSNCIPETFMMCDENEITLTTGSGTPNDGEATLIMEECSSKGHKLSDASGALAGNSIYAIIQGRENTNVVSRMDGSFRIKEADTCEKVDITLTFGESYLNLAKGTGDEVKISAQIVKTWYKDDVERFTTWQPVEGNYTWNEALPLKDQCSEQCMTISIIQSGSLPGKGGGDSCVIWGGSVKQYMQSHQEGVFETILVDIENCPFINNFGEKEMPPYVTVRWDKSIKCPAGMYLDDNWFLMEKFVEKDSCKPCEANTYSVSGGEKCVDCPTGKIAASDVPSGHDSPNDCRACTFGKFYTRDMTLDVSLDGVAIFTPYYCEVCGNDEYNDVLGASECKTCPFGKSARGENADDHRSVDTCVKLCTGGDTYFVEGGVYCKSKKFGVCYSFGYKEDAWCEDCSACTDCKNCNECKKCGGGRKLEEEGRQLSGDQQHYDMFGEEPEATNPLPTSTSVISVVPRRREASLLEGMRESFALMRESRNSKNKLVSFYKKPESKTPLQPQLTSVLSEEEEFDRALAVGQDIVNPCDTLWYGFGLKGGITKFSIVNPGGGLHPGLFQIDLYHNPEGQIDWHVFGPIKTKNHYYRHCDDMTQPTLAPYDPCPVGMYSTGGTQKPPCAVCSAGTYADSTGANACTSCPSGKYLLDNKQMRAANHDSIEDCADKVCPAGRYILPDSSTGTLTSRAAKFSIDECGPCPVGKFSGGSSAASSCESCAKGTYANIQGSYECTYCSKGSYAATTASITCALCSSGYYGETVGAESVSDCTACDAGTYSEEAGATSVATCKPCKSGTSSGSAGAGGETSCVACARGKYALKTGSAMCDNCVQGTFTNSTGAERCIGCGYGRYGDVVGATSEDTGCKDCQQGKYNGFKSASVCELCAAPLIVTKDKADCVEEEPDPVEQTMAPTETPSQQTSAPTPTPAPEIDPSRPQEFDCVSTCSPNLFAACDTSLFINPCSAGCDPQHVNILSTFFNQGCPKDFQGVNVVYIEIVSGYDVGGVQRETVSTTRNAEYLRTVLQVGQSSLMPGVSPDQITITNEESWTDQTRKLVDTASASFPVRFRLKAPLDNVASGQGVSTPDSTTAAGKEAMKKIAQDLWNGFESAVTSGKKDVVIEGIARVGELPSDNALGTQLKTASVVKTSFASPEINIVVIEPEEGGDSDDDTGKTKSKNGIVTKDMIFFAAVAFVVIGLAAGGFVFYRRQQAKKAEEEAKSKKKGGKRTSTAGKRTSAAGNVAKSRDDENAVDGVELLGQNPMRADEVRQFQPMPPSSLPPKGLAPAPSSVPPPPPLPRGWTGVYDAGQGAYYFVNDATRATQWQVPR